MSETRQAYSCYTCSKAITFHGTRVRYNLDGSLHLCKLDDKIAYGKFHEYVTYNKAGWLWRFTGEDFWRWKKEVYDVQYQRYRSYYDRVKEQEQKTAEAAEEARRRRVEEERRRRAAEEAAEERRRRAAEERHKKRSRRRRRSRRSRIHESYQQEKLEQALETMGLSVDILKPESKEVLATIKDRFRTLAMKFHPDRKGGDASRFIAMNQAYEYLLQTEVCGIG
jgi:glutamate synthase domain-containing protein 2